MKKIIDPALDFLVAGFFLYLCKCTNIHEFFNEASPTQFEIALLITILLASSAMGEACERKNIIIYAFALLGVFFLLTIVFGVFTPMSSTKLIGVCIFLQTLFAGFVGIRKK